MDKLNLAGWGERLKSGGAEVSRMISGKMKGIVLQGHSQEAKMVAEATSDKLQEPNWGLNLRICGFLNREELNGSEVVRAIKRRIGSRSVASQRLSLDLLEACAMNCDKVFSEIASEKVLDEMLKLIDNPQADYANRNKALQLIEAWGQSDDLAYLPIFQQTYMSLKTKKMGRNGGNDDERPAAASGRKREEEVVAPEWYHFRTDLNHPNPSMDPGIAISSEEDKKETLTVARNCVEILSSIFNSQIKENKPIENDELIKTMVERCKEAQPVIKRTIESSTEDEVTLFEALNLHEELQKILSQFDELKLHSEPPNPNPVDGAPSDADEKKEEHVGVIQHSTTHDVENNN